jgi:23S rRNA G2445 N2-methylase RlmL
VLGRSRLSTRRQRGYRDEMSEAERKERLAAALRANLRKRKVQAREQAEEQQVGDQRVAGTASDDTPGS